MAQVPGLSLIIAVLCFLMRLFLRKSKSATDQFVSGASLLTGYLSFACAVSAGIWIYVSRMAFTEPLVSTQTPLHALILLAYGMPWLWAVLRMINCVYADICGKRYISERLQEI